MRAKSIPTLLLVAAAAMHGDTYPRQDGIDAQHYRFSIALRDDSDEIAGEAAVDLRFVKPGVTRFSLDLGAAMTVTAVTADGGVAPRYSHEGARLWIVPQGIVPQGIGPAGAPRAGERRVFTIRYHGVPKAGLRIGANKYGERTFFSANWPDLAREWLPTIDHPYDKATSEFLITAPANYQVVANGVLVEQRDLDGGMRLTHWKQGVPIASWLNAVGVAGFASRHIGSAAGVPLETWVYGRDRDAGIRTFETATRQAVEFYSDYIGPYPYEKLADVEAAGLSGGTEHASAIFYGEKSVTGEPREALVAHEIAHQWFGDSVTEKDWDDVWLSEGFATYFALLYREHFEGRDGFTAGLKRSRELVFATQKELPGEAVLHHNLADMSKVLNRLVYEKGGWVLHMLRAQVGPEAFRAGIREYYGRYRDGNASTEDFRRTMEETAHADLGWFFRQWLERAGTPVLDGSWKYDAGSHSVEIDLAQTQAGEVYRLPLEVAVGGAAMRMEMTERRQHFTLHADAAPARVALDPNVSTLMEARFAAR